MTGRLGEYSIVRELGRGGMGVVYEAQERLSGRPVALKVMHDRVAGTARGRELFLSEMSILGTLDHPNVVRLLSGFEHQGQLVMVLELIRGQTIREIVQQRGRLLWQDAVFIARQMLHGLVAAHERAPPVVHRDLKPVNVMLTYEGIAKVMDFGIAKVVEGETHATTDVGTLRYMSPEQIDGGLIDARSDLYAVGLLLYEMLSGAAPFQSQSTRELLTLQCTAPAPPLAAELGTPGDLVAIIETLLAKAASERPASARVALAMLESLGPVAQLSFSLGHPGPAVVPASPGSNFPGASGWSTASSWGGQGSSGWQPTGATNGPASAQPVTGGVVAPGRAMPGASQWNPSMPGAQVVQAPTRQGYVAPDPTPPVASGPQAAKGHGWKVVAGVVAVGLVGILGWVLLALSSDEEGVAANLPSLPSLPAFTGAAAEPESGPTGKFADQAESVCRGRPSLSSSSSVSAVVGVAEVDGDGVEDVIVRLARPTSGDTKFSLVAISGLSMEVLWAADEVDGVLPTAAVAEDAILLVSGRMVWGLSVKTGTDIWSKKVSDSVSSAVVVDGRLLVESVDNKHFAFDVGTGASAGGQRLSEGLLPGQFGRGLSVDVPFHAGHSPSVEGFEFVRLVSSVSSCQGTLAEGCWTRSSISLFEKSIGTPWTMIVRGDGTRLKWSREFEELSSRDVMVVHRGGHVAVVKDTNSAVDIRMLDVESGSTRWSFAWEGGHHFGSAAFGNDRLFLNASCLLALDPKSGEILGAY